MTFSIKQQDRLNDIVKMFDDQRLVSAMIDIAEAVAIDERMWPVWPECPLDQMYISLDEWKEAMLAARDFKQGELSATAFRQRLAKVSAALVRAMVNVEDI